jgi:hypothetical protein
LNIYLKDFTVDIFNKQLSIEQMSYLALFYDGLIQIHFPSSFPYSIILNWKLELLNETSLEVMNTLDLSKNPTSTTLNLILPSNSLAFGMHKITFYAKLTLTNISLNFYREISTFQNIIRSGIDIKSIPNGQKSVSIGINQSIKLSPALYSVDSDQLIDIKSLRFKFYCKLVNKTLGLINYVQNNNTSYPDLEMAKTANYLPDDSCFNDTNSFSFNSDKNDELILNKSALKWHQDLNNIFIISTESYAKTYYEILNLIINPGFIQVPVASIR